MKSRKTPTLLLVTLAILSILPLHIPPNPAPVSAQPAARLEVWNDTYGSNMTDLSKTSGQINVEVNVTGAGQINAFDVSLSYYNLTIGGPVLQNGTAKADFTGSIFANAGCTNTISRNDVGIPAGSIRVAAFLLGCLVDGTGTLFTLTFDIVGVGAAAVDIVQTNTAGNRITILASAGNRVPYDAFDAYFRNKQGIPPVADFTYLPAAPKKGSVVTFDGTSSVDPNNSTGPGKGISRWVWKFGDGTSGIEGNISSSTVDHIFINPPVTAAVGNYTVTLIVRDYSDGLASRKTAIVDVEEGISHNIAVVLTSNGASTVQLTAGTTLILSLTVTNKGNRNETADVKVNYDLSGVTLIGREPDVKLDTQTSQTFQYNLNTTGLVSRAYSITASGTIYNATNNEIIPDDSPLDNSSTVTMTILSTGPGPLSLPIVIAIVAVVIVAALLVVRRLRRRKEET